MEKAIGYDVLWKDSTVILKFQDEEGIGEQYELNLDDAERIADTMLCAVIESREEQRLFNPDY